MVDLSLRDARVGDAEQIAAIYAHYVHNSVATFDEMPPHCDVFAQRIDTLITQNFPYLVAVSDDRVVGYAYAGPHKERAGYRFTVEDSVYIERGFIGRGIGRALLTKVIEMSVARGFRQMVAVIGVSDDPSSVALHRSLGFTQFGRAKEIGFKFGAPVDVVYMQRPLADHRAE